MNEHLPGNVGVADEAVRSALAAAIVLGAGVALAHFGADWFLFIFLGAGLAVAYLALTSASHVDLLYTALDIDTRHRRADVLTIEDERDPDVAASRAP